MTLQPQQWVTRQERGQRRLIFLCFLVVTLCIVACVVYMAHVPGLSEQRRNMVMSLTCCLMPVDVMLGAAAIAFK